VLPVSRILVADSEPHIRLLCLEELRDDGHEVQVAGTGGDVVRLVDSFHPDVVILEVLLPDMSGLEAGRIVKGTRRETRIILYSHGQPPRNLDAWGADAYVFKSADLEPLKATVRNLLYN
jgi:DNA-binding response OmpR family regulator